MNLTELLRRLAERVGGTGFFGFLESRDANKGRVALEKARQKASVALISQLPDGAVFREGTPDGWREIWMPPPPDLPVIFLPAAREPGCSAGMPGAIAGGVPKAISEEGER